MKHQLFKRDRAAAVVVHNNNLLVIERVRPGHQYYALPGGGINKRETPADAAVRETYEETSVMTKTIRQLYHHSYRHGEHHYFLCSYISGKPQLGNCEEAKRFRTGSNEYHPQWLPVNKLKNIELRPTDIRAWLSEDLIQGFAKDLKKANLKTHADWKR